MNFHDSCFSKMFVTEKVYHNHQTRHQKRHHKMHKINVEIIWKLTCFHRVHFIDDICRHHWQNENCNDTKTCCQICQRLVFNHWNHYILGPSNVAWNRVDLFLVLNFENQDSQSQKNVNQKAYQSEQEFWRMLFGLLITVWIQSGANVIPQWLLT